MKRNLLLTAMGLLLLTVSPLPGGPVERPYREAHAANLKKREVKPGQEYEFIVEFRGNERACIIIEADHKPPVNLTLKVFDRHDKLVAEDKGVDWVSAIWYPLQTGKYTIKVRHDDRNESNFLDIVVK